MSPKGNQYNLVMKMASFRRKAFVQILLSLILFSGCKPVSWMNSPNDLHQQRGTLFFVNGIQEDGLITVNFESGLSSRNYIELTREGATKKVTLQSIRGYRLDKDQYTLKEVDVDFSGSRHLLFVRQITRDSSRIGFYELYQQKTSTTGEGMYSYFISLPGHGLYETWNIAGRELEPDFNVKMSRVVSDCPSLASKILDKAQGYFLPAYTRSDARKVRVINKIIEEYNSCK